VLSHPGGLSDQGHLGEDRGTTRSRLRRVPSDVPTARLS
jgi:hypothetical protein